ncbi:hypothetical protein [Cellulomonas sp. KRMCY2]|uniref:hypothetical protein n=1 Tax=Cellulomonas sp. KRMCY2 TaxID=1304865 RepID=UPI0012DE33B4|nr:hypothetical protein [Cellulomonas sp. KRMCY2]
MPPKDLAARAPALRGAAGQDLARRVGAGRRAPGGRTAGRGHGSDRPGGHRASTGAPTAHGRRAGGVRGSAAAAARTAGRATSWWRRLSLPAATVVMAAVAALALTAGIGASALVAAPAAGPRAGAGDPLPGSTALGPVSIVLPRELGPWTVVPEDTFAEIRGQASTSGFTIDAVWGAVAPGDLIVTVMRSQAHYGVESLTGPFDDNAVDLPWNGSAPHVAGSADTDGLRELLLAVELEDGGLAVLSISGPVASFAGGELEEAFRSVRLVD